MENYENSSHAQRVESMIHFLIELYRNLGEDSETEWRGQKKNIRKLVVLRARVTVQSSETVTAAHLCPTLTCMEKL